MSHGFRLMRFEIASVVRSPEEDDSYEKLSPAMLATSWSQHLTGLLFSRQVDLGPFQCIDRRSIESNSRSHDPRNTGRPSPRNDRDRAVSLVARVGSASSCPLLDRLFAALDNDMVSPLACMACLGDIVSHCLEERWIYLAKMCIAVA
jgi:hypothetical protein